MHKHWETEEFDRHVESLKKALESLRQDEQQLEKKLEKRGTAAKQRKPSKTEKPEG
jgi:prefoldin subunit 5